ncbi:MAG: RNA polymerase sigma factor [Bacteroidota bacterium]
MNWKTYSNESDETLQQLFLSSRNLVFVGILLDRYQLLLFGVAMNYFKNKSMAEEATQQIIEIALNKWPKEKIANVKGWLYIIMRNYCLQQLRDKKGIDSLDAKAWIDQEEEANPFSLSNYLPYLEAALPSLPANQEQCIRLFYLQGKNYQEIMHITGYSFKEVKSNLQNGKRNLKIKITAKLKQHDA